MGMRNFGGGPGRAGPGGAKTGGRSTPATSGGQTYRTAPKVDTTPKTTTKTETPKVSSPKTGGYSNESNRFKQANDAAAAAAANNQQQGGQPPTSTPPPAASYSALHVGGAGLQDSQVLTGEIKTRLEALKNIEGPGREGYSWDEMGAPQNPNEARQFLVNAADHEANSVAIIDLDEAMLQNIQRGMRATEGSAEYNWAKSMDDHYKTKGSKVYIIGDKILDRSNAADAKLIQQRDSIEQFRAVSNSMIESHRLEQNQMAKDVIFQGFDMAQIGLQNIGSQESAQISAQGARDVARIGAERDVQIEGSRRAGAKEIQEMQGAQATSQIGATGTQARLNIAAEGAQTRENIGAEGAQQRRNIQTEGEEARKGIYAQGATRLSEIGAESSARLDQIRQEGANMIAQIDRQSNQESQLLEMSQSHAMALQDNQQAFQTAQNELNRAVERGDQENVRYQTNMQAMLAREKLQTQRWEKNIDTVLALGENPAMLYHLNQTGMLKSILGDNGNLGSGVSLNDVVGDLTAMIDPAKMPNIQGYNMLSDLEQKVLGWNLGATRGMSAEGIQQSLQGGTPFTRGQQSTVKVGSTRNPFQAGNI